MNKETLYIKKNLKKALWITAAFSAVINIFMLVIPIYSLQVLDRVISSRSTETLAMLTLFVAAIIAFHGVFTVLREMVMSGTSKWLDKKIASHLVHETYDHVTLETKKLPSQNLRDFETIKAFMNGAGFMAIFDAPWSFIFMIVLLMIHPYLALLVLVSAGILLAITYIGEKNLKAPQEDSSKLSGAEMYHIDSFHKNSMSIKAMRMGAQIKYRWSEIHQMALAKKEYTQFQSSIFKNIAKSFRMIVQMLVTCIGAFLVLQHQMTTGGMIASGILAGRVLAPFEVAIGSWTQFVKARQSYDNIKEVTETSLANPKDSMLLPEPKGLISFEDVYFKGTGKDYILQKIDLTILPGTIVCIIGPSAAGKTTIASLALGIFKPTNGVVRWDGANINDMNLPEYGQYIGYLSQGIELFDGTIKENIARMLPKIDDTAVIRAAQITGNHELILALPEGYETKIGKNGYKLSAGQKQRIALARAFYGNPKVIILDEPNSNLDDVGNRALLGAVEYAKQHNITTLIITHRPAILNACDKALIVSGGKIVGYDDVQTIQDKIRDSQPS